LVCWRRNGLARAKRRSPRIKSAEKHCRRA
jgi:hypothetical protein